MMVIRFTRQQRRITQTDLAREVGISQPRMSDIENGRAVPTVAEMERIARILGVPLAQRQEEKGIEREVLGR